MAQQHGIPGEWARVRGTVLSLWPLFLSFLLLGVFLGALISGGFAMIFAVPALCACLGVVAAWRKGTRRVESFFTGARGEERVAAALGALSNGYHVFNDFVAGRHHVDHVVMGPTGVYVVETKNWAGRVTVEEGYVLVGGRLPSRNPIEQARRETAAVKERLREKGIDAGVTGVLCFASDSLVSTGVPVNGITLVNVSEINEWITARTSVIPETDVARMAELVR